MGLSSKDPFFMGTHCEPISPINQNGPDSQDLMEAILKRLGPLDQSDLSFITDPDVADQLESMNQNPHKTEFKKIFPDTHNDLIEVLQSMLEFNPFLRKNPEELLRLEKFEIMKQKYPELLVPPTEPIKLEIDG